MNTTPEHMTQLLMMTTPDLRRHLDLVKDVIELRARHFQDEQITSAEEVNDKPLTQAPLPQTALIQRRPMRPPSPGSLRATVHQVLSTCGRPMRRNEVIEGVARIRGVQIDNLLKAKVSDALSNRHDTLIRKVTQGIYQATTTQEAACI